MHNHQIIIIGMGEMAGVFARGLLKSGYTITPVRRDDDIDAVAATIPNPDLVLVAVGENDLQQTLQTFPQPWKKSVALLQNELLPNQWLPYQLQPSVISVWFEKKKGQDFKVLVPSPIFGPGAEIIQQALAHLEIPSWIVTSSEEMLFELVRKNVYILMTNIAGMALPQGSNVEALWQQHHHFATTIANEVIDLQFAITGQAFDRTALLKGVESAIYGDLQHQCMGRSAPARLARALTQATELKLELIELSRLSSAQNR
jgi:hypothetical protein